MLSNIEQNEHGSWPALRVVYGSTFDKEPYSITLEDEYIGIGSSARIRKGYISGSNRLVAVKVFGDLLSREREQMLFRELHFASNASLRHPRILAFLGTAAVGEQTAIVSLYMKNGNIMEYIRVNPNCDKKRLIIQVAEAVEFLHVTATEKLVHGDLKCENVLVSDVGDALLADFGLSSFVEKSENLSTTLTAVRKMSTIQFAAPELLGIPEDAGNSKISLSEEDDPPVSKKTTESDVYAFGMLVLQAISEKPPWGKKNELAVIKSLSAGKCPSRPILDGTFGAMSRSWWDICRSCWRFKSHERPAISDVLRSLQASDPLERPCERLPGRRRDWLLPSRELPLQGRMASAEYTQDETTIIARPYRNQIMLFDIGTDHIRHWLMDLQGRELPLPEERMAFGRYKSDGTTIVARPYGNQIMLFDIGIDRIQHQRIGYLGTEFEFAARPAVSPDGETIACFGNKEILVEDVSSGDVITTMDHHSHPTCVAYSPDSECIASGTYDGTVQLWDAAIGVALGPQLTGHPDTIIDVSFSQDGAYFASASGDGTIRLWDSMTYAPAATLKQPNSGAWLNSMVFSPVAMHIVTADSTGTVTVWDVREGRITHTFTINGGALCAAFSPSGEYVAAGGKGGKIIIWDILGRNTVTAVLHVPDETIFSVAFSPDEKSLVAVGSDRKIRVWTLFN